MRVFGETSTHISSPKQSSNIIFISISIILSSSIVEALKLKNWGFRDSKALGSIRPSKHEDPTS
ncbi:hypothetical protein LguiB_006327 [Lonicera macranthoides]